MKKLTLLLLSVLFALASFANDRSCQAPTNVEVTILENEYGYDYKYKVIISWDEVEGSQGYSIYCQGGTLPEGEVLELGTTTACMYYAGANNPGTLSFQVAAICASGDYSEMSESVEVFIGPKNDCPAPTGFNATVAKDNDINRITFTWDAAEGSESYSLLIGDEEITGITETEYVYETNAVGNINVYLSTECEGGPSNQTSLTIDLSSGDDNNGNEGNEGNEDNGDDTAENSCHGPENIDVVVDEHETGYDVIFSWDAVPGAVSYKLYTNGNYYAQTSSTSIYDELPLSDKGTDVTLGIVSICESEMIQFTTPIVAGEFKAPESSTTGGCAAPNNFTIKIEENVPGYEFFYKITISWDPVPGAAEYKLLIMGYPYYEGADTEYVVGLSEAVAGVDLPCGIMAICESEMAEVSFEVVSVEEEYESLFAIYPNPVNDRLIVETNEDVKGISIYNIVGIPVYQANDLTDNNINVSDFADGVYFINIKTDKGEIIKKFIKK